MMKKMMVMMGLLGAVGVMAAETVLYAPKFVNPKEAGVWTGKSIKVDNGKTANGVARFTVTANDAAKKSASTIQTYFGANITLKKGKAYQLSAIVKSDKDVMVNCSVMQSRAPFKYFVGKKLNLKAGKAQNLVMDFTVKEDFKDVLRLPSLHFGLAPAGTTVEISGVKFVEK